MSSRLFQEVRERRGLAYAVYSYRVRTSRPARRRVRRHRTGRAAETIDVVGTELDRVIRTPASVATS
jgi:predicted Zn-dependent peptidase